MQVIIGAFLIPNYFAFNEHGRLVDLVHVIRSTTSPNNGDDNLMTTSYKCVHLNR